MKGLAILCFACAAASQAQEIAVPSGQPVRFFELIRDVPGPGGTAHRFRFVAPEIAREGGAIDPAAASADLDALCEIFVLPRLADATDPPDQVILSLSDRAVPFGEPAPDATQIFESYRVENGVCIWEEF